MLPLSRSSNKPRQVKLTITYTVNTFFLLGYWYQFIVLLELYSQSSCMWYVRGVSWKQVTLPSPGLTIWIFMLHILCSASNWNSGKFSFSLTSLKLHTGFALRTLMSIVEINECNSSPCGNGGNCGDDLNSYTCGCVTGYIGMNCESGTVAWHKWVPQNDVRHCSVVIIVHSQITG